MTPTWAVVPTKNRHDLVRELITSLHGQVGGVVVVDNNDTPDPVHEHEVEFDMAIVNIHHPGYPPNLSELYNIGIDAVDTIHAPAEWNVALFNDDVVAPSGWAQLLDNAMRSGPAAMAYVDRMNRSQSTLYTQAPQSPFETATVWACLMRGELHLRFDESMRWWYSDTDLDYRARQVGGVLAVPGVIPEHKHPSVQTVSDPNLSAQTHVDRETFARKWNGAPW